MTYIGNEQFLMNGKYISLTIGDFWRWAYSDLDNNIERTMLAKFIVASALEISSIGTENMRSEEKTYDLLSKDGYKINVKSAAYIQTWDEERPDHISFSIAPLKSAGYNSSTFQRISDAYIFCLYKAQTTGETPLDLDLWDFYVLPTKILNEKKPNQKTITLPSLMKMEPIWCDYYGINEAIQKAMTV